jgi:RNA polymerase sigma factor (sigma-70 family)
MNTKEEGPDPCDLEAWRKVIGSPQFPRIRGQCLVAAIQKIGSNGDRRVVEALMKEISDRIMRILRKHIGRNHRNEGWDMIHEAHGKLIEAVLKPNSADGSALLTAFVTTIRLRGADAIRREELHKDRYPYSEDQDVVPFRQKKFASEDEERAHVEAAIRRIKDPRKRLAFRLHMDGVPRHSTKVESIASALGVSAKTAETWIKETEKEIETILGVKP